MYYYELFFDDYRLGWSICVKGIRKPSCAEATEFWKELVAEYGRVTDVCDLDDKTAHEDFNCENEDNWPVFGVKELWYA